MHLGIDELLQNASLRRPLEGRRVALLGHPASVTRECRHSLDALTECPGLRVAAAFGPQHGMRGDRQDNMIETDDYIDLRRNIPVFSLYGQVRRPTSPMMETFDVLLVDLQDIGTRTYTYVTTLAYCLEACAEHRKSIWILDRPNPIGRPIEGSILEDGWASFVGIASLMMRHGLTLGELARWFVAQQGLDVDLNVIRMADYEPEAAPGYGWPLHERSWVNPSPNASSLNMARCFPGTVLFEGTTLSEGRGTTMPLEVVGAGDIDSDVILRRTRSLAAPWLAGCSLRPCCFEPTFDKRVGEICSGVQIHTDNDAYRHEQFRPYRLAALVLKAVRLEYPDYPLWRQFPFEYETERLAFDLLSGGTFLRDWVDDPGAEPADLDSRLSRDERRWQHVRAPFLLY